MAHQIDDQQFYAVKAALERARAEIEQAFVILYANINATTAGAAPTMPNPGGGKNFNVTPPTVTKDHQSAADSVNPVVQSELKAAEQTSQAALKQSINSEVLVINASANGAGSYFALVQCEDTKQQASIPIEEYEYDDLCTANAEDDVRIELSQDQIDEAEWEPLRGVSKDPAAQCSCGGQVTDVNPYNDPKIECEIAAQHTRKCAFWDFNTVTYDQQTGRSCQVDLDKIDKSAKHGFDIYVRNRQQILARAADPNDTITLCDAEEGEEFGFNQPVQQPMGGGGMALMPFSAPSMNCNYCGNNFCACICEDDEDDV